VRWLSPLWRRPRHRADESLATLVTRGFVALDLETTGLDPRRDAIVSLAAVRFSDAGARPALVTLVNPGRPIPPSSTVFHGIEDAMVADAPDEPTAVRWLDDLCVGQVVVGHAVEFDLAVIARARGAAGTPALAVVCTRRLGAWLEPGVDPGLDALCETFGIAIRGRHTAEGDAEAAGRLFLALMPALAARGIRSLAELLWVQEHARRP
jgi:DNA polymerase-3 subunit epsilon